MYVCCLLLFLVTLNSLTVVTCATQAPALSTEEIETPCLVGFGFGIVLHRYGNQLPYRVANRPPPKKQQNYVVHCRLYYVVYYIISIHCPTSRKARDNLVRLDGGDSSSDDEPDDYGEPDADMEGSIYSFRWVLDVDINLGSFQV